jgi:peptidoglycan/LPS O-acetylase OafA/YrhL
VIASEKRARFGYQPALDGVRALAMALVVLVHYPWGVASIRPKPFGGGFLGVDAFFVLSGFLITTLLLQEHARFGAVSLRRFYARRALRLLPALAVLLVIACVLHVTLAAKDPNRPETNGLLGAAFYVANWVGIYQPRAVGVIFDTWSLAIEEQFYVVWPLILVLLLTRRVRARTLALLTAGGIAASAAWRAWYWNDHLHHLHQTTYTGTNKLLALVAAEANNHRLLGVWQRIYFGSDTRADSLLAGCLTAILLFFLLPRLGDRARSRLGWLAWGALLAAGVIIWRAVYIFSGWLPDWGFLAFAVAIGVLIAGLVASPGNPVSRVLALAPLAWLGRRSYAIYLFHPLVFAYLDRQHVHLSPPLSFVFQVGVILVVGELSYRLVEAPMLRRKTRFEARDDGTIRRRASSESV